ncbi:MAG: energy transducer TonB [Rhodanobacter sp.]|jgi:protein TonB|nr:energy transducer TonB [Rhodanobacter sp.]
MLRLRTSSALSALALAIGIAGTSWLSTLTSGWPGPRVRVAATRHGSLAQRPSSPSRHGHGPVRAVQVRHPGAERSRGDLGAAQAAATASTSLQPVAMPADTARSWDRLRGHLDGRVVLHLDIDGNGRVHAASLIASSGDPVLDQHALHSVRGWRFAVPTDRPAGISGELPMVFTSRTAALARLP